MQLTSFYCQGHTIVWINLTHEPISSQKVVCIS